MKIVIGNDHSAVELKNIIKAHLEEKGYEVMNVGTDTSDSCDYPVYGEKVGRAVASGEADLGIAICGDGTVDGVRVLSEKAIAMMRQEQSVETTGITSDTPYSFFTIRKDSLLDGRRVYGHQGTDEGIICNLYVEPVSQTVFCVMTNGCKTTREDGIMRITRRLCAAAAEVFLPEAD